MGDSKGISHFDLQLYYKFINMKQLQYQNSMNVKYDIFTWDSLMAA